MLYVKKYFMLCVKVRYKISRDISIDFLTIYLVFILFIFILMLLPIY